MKQQRHPTSIATRFSCGNCGTTFEIASTARAPETLDACSNCHPAYTGTVKTTVSGDRIEAFNSRYKNLGLNRPGYSTNG